MPRYSRVDYTVSDAGKVWFDVCDACGCLCGARHTCYADAPATVEEAVATQEHTAWGPLTMYLVDRDGTAHFIDGRLDDTRVSLANLDPVTKAAWKVLLQQALNEIDPPAPQPPRYITTNTGGPVG